MKINERIDKLTLLQTLVRIVEGGSLSEAARQLSTSQATVSRRLQSLEQLLGVPLLMRNTHAIRLTDEGTRCYRHARGLLSGWTELEDALMRGSDTPVGRLRVRAPHAFGQDQLMTPLVDYLRRWPEVNVEWMLSDRVADFNAEHIDCAILIGNQPDPATIAVHLAEVPRILVAAPELAARLDDYNALEQIEKLPWVSISTFYRNHLTLHNTRQPERQHRLEMEPRLYSDSLYATRQAILQGIGIGLVSSWIVTADLAAGRLVHLAPDWRAEPLAVRLVYPYAPYYPARLTQFLAMMREVMPGIAGMSPPPVTDKTT